MSQIKPGASNSIMVSKMDDRVPRNVFNIMFCFPGYALVVNEQSELIPKTLTRDAGTPRGSLINCAKHPLFSSKLVISLINFTHIIQLYDLLICTCLYSIYFLESVIDSWEWKLRNKQFHGNNRYSNAILHISNIVF